MKIHTPFKPFIFIPASYHVTCGLVLILFFFSTANAQSIKASINKNKILIGEQAELVIETEASGPLFVTIDTIPHFEIAGFPKIDTTDKGGSVIVHGIYTITSFDSGSWTIPSFSIARGISSDSLKVDVVFSEFDPTQPYHDIKDIIETKEERKKFPWWWIVTGAVLISALIYYFIKRKPAKRTDVTQLAQDPYREAMQRLEQLARGKPVAKEYYSSLTDIFRIYIFKSKGIRSLQKTTDDLVVQLSSLSLPRPLFDELAQTLRMSDFVKFAKYSASEEDDSKAITVIRSSIEQIEKMHAKPSQQGGAGK